MSNLIMLVILSAILIVSFFLLAMLIIKMKFDLQEMYDALPEIKVLTFFLVIGFVLLHGLSGKLNGGKIWLARRHPFVWGAICGLMLTLAFYLRPAETIDFIYIRF